MYRRGKRGIAHIEIIISFAVFMAVILTSLYFYDSTANTKKTDTSNLYAFSAIEKNLTDKIEIYSIKVNPSGQSKAVLTIILDNITGKGSHAEDENGNTLSSYVNGNEVRIDESANNDFIYLFISISFDNGAALSNLSYSASDYSILGKRTVQGISENKANILKSYYDSNYEGVKIDLGISENSDFSFSLRSDSNTIATAKNISDNSEVYSSSENVILIDNEGKDKTAQLGVMTW